MLRRLAGLALIGLLLGAELALSAYGTLTAGLRHLVLPPLDAGETSTLVLDHAGRLLRPFARSDGRWRLPVSADDVDERFVAMLLAYEDGRFREHPGIDPLALVRATLQAASAGRIVSGGSTITMQLARLLEPRRARSLPQKLKEMRQALAIEQRLTKDQILSLYLTLAPYGGNLEGVRAASLAYFGKEPRRLSLAEAALLVALPQSPEARRPDRHPDAARRARDRVLDRMVSRGVLRPDQAALARLQPAPTGRRPFPMLAPHLGEAAVAAAPERRVHRLTIDRPLQESLEALARDRARALGPRISVAILAVENDSGRVLASVGSADFMDAARTGQVDMTGALRSPGSALKPLIYGLAFEDGVAHPETILDDRPSRFGGHYVPENFDEGYQGAVTARRALQLSLNVPAVALLEAVGVNRFLARLRAAGVGAVLPRGEAPGLAVGLGGLGIRLRDLAALYAGFAQGGETVRLVTRADDPPPAETARFLDRGAAWHIGDVLLGAPPPEAAAGGRIAFKTGTSYGYRDAWAAGFDGRRTVAVWVGRPDGASVPGLVGRGAAAPILFEAFQRIGAPVPLPHAPAEAFVAAGNAALPPPLRRFARDVGSDGRPRADPPLRIVFPPEGARIDVGAARGDAPDPLALKAAGGAPPFTWLANGAPVGSPARRRDSFWSPDGPGFARLTVIDARGQTDAVTVRLE